MGKGWKQGWRVKQEKEFKRFRFCLVVRRFMEFVDFKGGNDCWEWKGSGIGGFNENQYGQFIWKEQKVVQAHVAAYILFVGDIPHRNRKKYKEKTTCVLHSCDNYLCVNPSHLFLGTCKDNVADSMQKGRRAFIGLALDGSFKNVSQKKVKRIVKYYSTGKYSRTELAIRYGLNYKSVKRMIKENT